MHYSLSRFAAVLAVLGGTLTAAASAWAAPTDLAVAFSSPTAAPKFSWTLPAGEQSNYFVLTQGNKAVHGRLRGSSIIDKAFPAADATSYRSKQPLFVGAYYWQVESTGSDDSLSPITKLTVAPALDATDVRVKDTPWSRDPHSQSIRATVHCNFVGELGAKVVVRRGTKIVWRGNFGTTGCKLSRRGASEDFTYGGGYTRKGAKLTARVTFSGHKLHVTKSVDFRALRPRPSREWAPREHADIAAC